MSPSPRVSRFRYRRTESWRSKVCDYCYFANYSTCISRHYSFQEVCTVTDGCGYSGTSWTYRNTPNLLEIHPEDFSSFLFTGREVSDPVSENQSNSSFLNIFPEEVFLHTDTINYAFCHSGNLSREWSDPNSDNGLYSKGS